MIVILSIRPEYCEKIGNGTKKYEFRRRAFKRSVNLVYMYSTSPVNKIVGSFSVESIIRDHPESLWQTCKEFSGIEEEEFFGYFGTCEEGIAIKIKEVTMFEPMDLNTVFPGFWPPQSYVYIGCPCPQSERRLAERSH